MTTGLYTFDPSFRFTKRVTHCLVELGVEGLLVVTRMVSVVNGANEGTDSFMMSILILGVCPQLGILQVDITPRSRVLVLDTGGLFAVRNLPHWFVWVVSHTSITIRWNPCNGILFQVRSEKHVHTSTGNRTPAKMINSVVSKKRSTKFHSARL